MSSCAVGTDVHPTAVGDARGQDAAHSQGKAHETRAEAAAKSLNHQLLDASLL